jgi:two-component system sensor histidine kinase CpxA
MRLAVRSLYMRIFLTCCGTLFVALGCFLAISLNVGLERSSKNFKRVFELELHIAEQIYNDHGPQALAAFRQEQDEAFNSRHFFVDAQGRDVLTGKDLHELLARRKTGSWTRRIYWFLWNYEATFVTPAPVGGRLRAVTITRPWSNSRAQFPYYLAVLIVVSVLNALVAVRIVSALQNIARTAQQFGEGDLEARVMGADRQDEVGLVSQAFNKMADRVHALVLSERRLVQDVSHEIRSPLARLSFAIELTQNSEDRNGAFALVRKQINTLTGLATSLLQTTRASDGRPLRTNERIPLRGLVDDVIHTNGLNAREKRCRLAERFTHSPVVTGDRALLTRVLDNVLRNAIEYSPADGRIDIEVRQERGEAVLAVRDYGTGVPGSMLASIFEPFFRVDESRESSTGGLGLGLAIVKRTVSLHGGSVTAENADPGLRVTVRLPTAASNSDVVPLETNRVA